MTFLFLLTLITPFKLIDAKENQKIKISGNFIKDNLEVIRNSVPDGIPDIMNLQVYKIENKIDGEYVNTNTGFKVKLNFYSLIGDTRDENGISYLDWECLSNGYQVYYVFVKAADGGYLYWYNNQEKSDTRLHGLEHKDGNNKCHDISHVEFYYGQIGSCKVTKTKDDDGDGKSDGPHEGVEFTLKNLETGVSYKKVTDKDGIALFENMPVGQNYTLIEEVPVGYTTSLTDNRFMIECGIQKEIEVMNTKIVEPINYPDITISKSDNDFTAKPGDEVTYWITVKNKGKVEAKKVKVFEKVPDYTSFVEGGNPGWTASNDGYVYDIGTLNAGEVKTISFKVKVDKNIPDSIKKIENTAVLSAKDIDDLSASDDTPITQPQPPPDLPSTGRENSFSPLMGILSVVFMALGILIKKLK